MRELSIAAARDEIAYYRGAIDGCDRKLVKLRRHIEWTESSRSSFVEMLEQAENELVEAEMRGVEAVAGAAEGEGGA